MMEEGEHLKIRGKIKDRSFVEIIHKIDPAMVVTPREA